MKAFLHLFTPLFLLAIGAFASSSDVEIEEWLAAAKRVSPEALKACPVPCHGASEGSSKAGWFLFPDAHKLALCNETMLLDMVVQNAAESGQPNQAIIRACTAEYEAEPKPAFVPDDSKASLCTTANRVLEDASISISHPQVSHEGGFSVDHLLSAARQITSHLALQTPSCANNAMEFAYSQSAVIGLFAGAEIHQHGVTADVLKKFLEYTQKNAISKTTIVQFCGADDRGADYSIGIAVSSAQNLPFVQNAVKTWANGECVSKGDKGTDWMTVTLRVPTTIETTSNNTTHGSNATTAAHIGARSLLSIRADCRTASVQAGDGCYAVSSRCGISQSDLEKYNRANLCNTLIKDEKVCCSSGTLPSTLPGGNSDGTCKTRVVVSGDSCESLASKCGISGADFNKVNTKTNLCSTLGVGQQVCCTNGKMPDLKPKQDANGNCATYTTKKDDSCSVIGASRDLTVQDLEDFNKKTWGWNGCDRLFPDYKMCVSTGSPPMPANVPNAVCGPTMNGTAQPAAGTDLAKLNPCPLNVCCNIWGQCGMTDDFCVISKSATGAPGTSAPGKNGCISNCGRDIIKGSAPASKIKVAYFEAWNFARKCLTMNVDQIDKTAYTHIHFAFANVTRGDFKVDISDESVKKQFELFKSMTGIKKILSLGGWAFSTEPGTFNILREAALPANRDTFKNNLIAFMNEHKLDGIDLDWEYPGAPDIPDIPSDDPVNGVNYYRLLSSLKASVGSSKTVSFAAPASYWYLKSFPIKKMADELDYIIYMTYDLHGQWDYGNKWTSPGCDTGNCLRSHVNETETKDALSMITKAGAASNKVVVGVASYGRSFKMAQAGCDSETCRFTGSSRVSNANKGRCTDTGGYIANAEIDEIISSGKVNKKWTSEGSNIMVYNDTEWVAWMDDAMKKYRSEFYDSYNFAGTTDWAVDLQTFTDGSSMDDTTEGYTDLNYWSACESTFTSLQQLEDRKGSVPAHCLEQYLLDVQVAVYEGALSKYKDLVDKGYDKKFQIYERYAKDLVPRQLNSFMASDKVDKYFKCYEWKDIKCCNNCRFCEPGQCEKFTGCKNGYGKVDMPKCPKIEFQLGTLTSTNVPNATFVLNDSKGFYDELSASWGIDQAWLTFDMRKLRINNGCQYAGKEVLECQRKNDDWFYDYPLATKIEIFNPKKIIGDSYPKAQDMLNRFQIVAQLGEWDDLTELSDSVDATSLPSFSMQEAVESMQKIVDKADEIKEQERKDFILNFITGLLFFIPVAGELAGAAGLTAARSLLRLLGTAGDAAMTIHDVINNPQNAFMSVFSFLAGAGVGRSGFKNAANSRRGISEKDYNALGNVKLSLDKAQSLRGAICPI